MRLRWAVALVAAVPLSACAGTPESSSELAAGRGDAVGTPSPDRPGPATERTRGLLRDVVPIRHFTDSAGFLHFIGVVENVGDQPVRSVEVVVSLYDASAAVVASNFAFAGLDNIPPRTRSPWEVVFLNPPEGWADFAVAYDFNLSSSWPYQGIQVVSHQMAPGTTGHEVRGEVKNVGPSRVEAVTVVATFYGTDGGVVGMAWRRADVEVLEPGAASAFRLAAVDVAGPVSWYELVPQGRPTQTTLGDQG